MERTHEKGEQVFADHTSICEGIDTPKYVKNSYNPRAKTHTNNPIKKGKGPEIDVFPKKVAHGQQVMAITQKSTGGHWRGCGEKGALVRSCRECKLVQPPWKTVWSVLRNKNRAAVRPGRPGNMSKGKENTMPER